MEPDQLLSKIYKPRILAWLLAGCMLVQALAVADPGLSAGLLCLLCLCYPHVVHFVLGRLNITIRDIRCSLLMDAMLVGVMIAALGFSINAGTVLVALLLASVVIIGGLHWLAASLPMLLAGVGLGACFLPGYQLPEPGFISQLALLLYIGMIAYLVYRETRFLYVVRRREFSSRHQVQEMIERLAPFVAPQAIFPGSERPVRKRLTVFFSDIAGFTHLMDTEDESTVAEWLNGYFDVMSRIATAHGGTVDKFLGDGMMVFFGDTDSKGAVANAHACLSMAIEMRNTMGKLSSDWRIGRKINIRVGIHTGYCLVGGFGSAVRKDYTIIGGSVNLASRIEGQAGRDEILVSAATHKLLQPWITVQPIGPVCLKGFSAPVSLFRVLALAPWQTNRVGELRLLT